MSEGSGWVLDKESLPEEDAMKIVEMTKDLKYYMLLGNSAVGLEN